MGCDVKDNFNVYGCISLIGIHKYQNSARFKLAMYKENVIYCETVINNKCINTTACELGHGCNGYVIVEISVLFQVMCYILWDIHKAVNILI